MKEKAIELGLELLEKKINEMSSKYKKKRSKDIMIEH